MDDAYSWKITTRQVDCHNEEEKELKKGAAGQCWPLGVCRGLWGAVGGPQAQPQPPFPQTAGCPFSAREALLLSGELDRGAATFCGRDAAPVAVTRAETVAPEG